MEIEIIEAGKRVVRAKIDGVEIWVDRDTLEKRARICARCEHSRMGYCKVCRCYLHLKRSLTTEGCPLGYWPAVDKTE